MTELKFEDLFATELLARNYGNLRHLRLGNEADLAKNYANDGEINSDNIAQFILTERFGEIMRKKVRALHEHSTTVAQLESLSLVGLDLDAFAQGLVEPLIDFGSLSVLTLESCIGLEAALPLLVGAGTAKRNAKGALRLHTLAIRMENVNVHSLLALENFVLSLKPLAHLHLLLEGDYSRELKMRKILRVHGRTLKSFIWDERMGPRSDMHKDTTTVDNDHENLKLIAKHCRALKDLGCSLDWEDISGSKKYHKEVKIIILRILDQFPC